MSNMAIGDAIVENIQLTLISLSREISEVNMQRDVMIVVRANVLGLLISPIQVQINDASTVIWL